ncbi:MAG: nucleotidyl transferase AbiEii/AbiGii toxin family protein [Oscillospiraceae bacterium]|nr:nucleotidyl transferase AbiEii/AbiGii toxin family protein [Oscillospiraceae bacterium]
MIPFNTVTAWGAVHPWPTREQIEQDLLLSKAIIEIYNNKMLAEELIFRGGTALHKMVLPHPSRYSEDLDFVRSSAGGIGDIMKELTELGKQSGFTVKTRMGQYPKVYWHGKAQTGRDLRIKIEINTYERSPVLSLIEIEYSINTDWFTGKAMVKMFQNEETAATKLRALYQRSKGRDLYDLWLLTNVVRIDPVLTCQAFETYRPDGYTAKRAIENLEKKTRDKGFLTDIVNMVSADTSEYNAVDAAAQVIEMYLLNL